MSQIEVFIDPNNPAHGELEEGLRKSLTALTSVSVTEQKKPVPPGTLAVGLDHAVAFVIQHQDKVLPLATAVLNVLSNLLRFRSAKAPEGEKDKPVVIVVKDERLSLPATDATQKKFLRRIQSAGSKLPRKAKTKASPHSRRPASSGKKTRTAGKRRR